MTSADSGPIVPDPLFVAQGPPAACDAAAPTPTPTLASLSGHVEASADEAARIAALHDMRVLDTAPDPRFDRIVRLAAQVFEAPRAAVILIDEHRLWMKAQLGFTGDEWPRRAALVETVLRRGEALYSGDVRADPRFAGATADSGSEARFYASAPLITPNGQIIGAVSVGDTKPHPDPTATERLALEDLAALAMDEIVRDAEAAIARERSAVDRERVDLALSAAGLASYEWDLASDRLLVSERLRALAGLSDNSMAIDRGEVVLAMVHPDDRERTQAIMREAIKGSGRYHHEHRVIRPKDGRTVWVASSGVIVRWPDGSPRRLIGVLQDITARKIAEDQRETLVAELDHRVKNVLAAVQSLAAQSARKASSLDGFLKTFAGRLKSMASAHELLTATRWRGASMHNIAAAELSGLAPGQTRWEGPDLLLTPRAANAMSLALHELATNAVKFGALSTDAGRVEVRWRRLDDGGLGLHWSESGGPPVAPPTRRGFGATLLEKVTGRELGGEAKIEHRREGVQVELTAGASAIAGAPPPAEPAAAAATTVISASGASGGPPRVDHAARVEGLRLLIVEDALLLALELEAGLTEAGAVVVGSAGDLAEAMGMVGLEIDAAVLDANLNGESVRPVAEALAARGVPFVFATGYGDDKITPEHFGAPVIRKPYDVTQVAAALAEVTGRV
jgi:PAS domain S-box-containing protein